jgi:hypothetical protein
MWRILGIRSWHEARIQTKRRGDPSSETEERHVRGQDDSETEDARRKLKR